MATQTAAPARPFELDPLRALWHLLTSVRFALAIIAFLALAALGGVAIPQVPIEMRGNPAAIAAWLQFQHGRFGAFSEPMWRLGLFDIFRSVWFTAGLGTLVVSVCVCTANRLPPVWRNVFQPQTRVPDDYFDRADAALDLAVPGADAIAGELRRRHYRVELSHEGATTYLFADRYPWAQFATFVSHLALILFLAGGLVTLLTAQEQEVFIAEQDPAGAPVFGIDDPHHMQIYVQDAVAVFDSNGAPRDYRTYLTVFRDGKQVAQGVTTVNRPLSYGGYQFHQSAYFPDGAGLQVREAATGRVVYDESLALTDSATTPRIAVHDATGALLLDDVIVPTDFLGDVAGTVVHVPGTQREFWIGAQPGDTSTGWQLVVFETANPDGARAVLGEGETRDVGGLSIDFVGMQGVPSTAVDALPGADGASSVAELSNGPAGPLLTIGPVQGQALALSPDQPVVVGDYAYNFSGKREFAGLTVRRDNGATVVWFATGTFLLGLALTFYTPRRRLWGKIGPGTAAFRGLGGRRLAIERELKDAAARSQTGTA